LEFHFEKLVEILEHDASNFWELLTVNCKKYPFAFKMSIPKLRGFSDWKNLTAYQKLHFAISSPYILKDLISDLSEKHWLLWLQHVEILRFLLKAEITEKEIQIFHHIVKSYQKGKILLYNHYIPKNHQQLHYADELRLHGSHKYASAYKLENVLQLLKKNRKRTNHYFIERDIIRRFWLLQFSQIFRTTKKQESLNKKKSEIPMCIREFFDEKDVEVVVETQIKGFTVTTEHWIKIDKCYIRVLILKRKCLGVKFIKKLMKSMKLHRQMF